MTNKGAKSGSFRKIGLGFQLFALLVLLLFVYFVVKTTIYLTFYGRELEKNVIHNAIRMSDLVKRSMRTSMLKNHRQDLGEIIDNLGREEGIEGIWVFNKEGKIEFSNRKADLGRVVDMKSERCVFCHGTDTAKGTIPLENRYRFLESEEGYRVLGLINPIETDDSCTDAECHAHSAEEKILGLMDIQLSLRDADSSVTRTRRTILIVSSVLVVLTAAFFWGLIHFLVRRPISRLIEGTRQVAGMNLDTEIEVRSGGEIADLADSFNWMTGELKRANEAVREWSATLEEKVRQKTEALEKAQANLILAEKMASLGKLTAMVAHQLNNPLAGILNYAKLTIRSLKAGADACSSQPGLLENLDVILGEAKRCGDIVNNMLQFSRKTKTRWTECELGEVVRRSAEVVRPGFEARGVELSVDVEGGDLRVVCDPEGIQQMLLALYINALEAVQSMPGHVRIKVRRLAAERKFRIEVSDTGKGIPEEAMPHIYEPFFTLERAGDGPGLGLAVVYGVVERHGGEISVQSSVGKGTTVTIDLPETASETGTPGEGDSLL